MTIWNELAVQEVRTSAESDDPALAGRTYTIPFDTVWDAVTLLAGGSLKGWKSVRADDQIGIVMADVKGAVLPFEAAVSVYVNLDANGQTRVDLWARGLHRGWGMGVHRRRVRRFLGTLDRVLNVRPGQILDPELFAPPRVPDPIDELEQPSWPRAPGSPW